MKLSYIFTIFEELEDRVNNLFNPFIYFPKLQWICMLILNYPIGFILFALDFCGIALIKSLLH